MVFSFHSCPVPHLVSLIFMPSQTSHPLVTPKHPPALRAFFSHPIPHLLLPPGPSLPPSSPTGTPWPPPAGVCSPTSHPSWAPRTQTSDTVCVQHLVLSTSTLAAPRGGQAQAAAAAIVHPAFVGTHCEGGVTGGRRKDGEDRGWVSAGSGKAREAR